VIRVADDKALGADPDVLPFERVAERDMGDLLGQPDREADMRAEDGVEIEAVVAAT
jgi:hypothetical protein